MFNWNDFMNDFPYTNFSDINVSWFLNKFKQIFDEWEDLYTTLQNWKTATDEANENWKQEQEQAFTTWENNFQNAIDEWKTQTETDIGSWESDTLANLETWKTAFITQYNALKAEVEQIAEDAETAKNSAHASAQSALASANSASATAESLSASLTQIDTNTDDISELKTQIKPLQRRLYDKYTIFTENNKRININGTIGTNTGTMCSGFIPVKAGDIISYRITNVTNYPAIAYYSNTEGEGFSALVIGTNNKEILEGFVTIANDGYIVACTTSAYINLGNPTIQFINGVDALIEENVNKLNTDVLTKGIKHYTEETPVYEVTTGIIRFPDLTIFSSVASYRHTSLNVNKGDVYLISGYGIGNNTAENFYPCAFIEGQTNKVLIEGGTQAYNNIVVAIPFSGVLYVNGSTSAPIDIKKLSFESDEKFLSSIDGGYKYRCKTANGELYVKWKSRNALNDIIIVMGNVGGNSLFNFSELFVLSNSNPLDDNFDTTNNIFHWVMNGSDWFGPYIVQAVNNADGDTPENVYFTGGNHRTTNSDVGGGITAHEISKKITVNGIIMQDNIVYMSNDIEIMWTNGINAYNTSKADGTGRDVLQETWNAKFTTNGVECTNTIEGLESIVINTYYGFQITLPTGSKFRFHGGNNRGENSQGDSTNSGNNTCRTAEVYNTYIDNELTVFDSDLGLFEHNRGYSFFTSATKLYSYIIASSKTVELSDGDTAYIAGKYTFA